MCSQAPETASASWLHFQYPMFLGLALNSRICIQHSSLNFSYFQSRKVLWVETEFYKVCLFIPFLWLLFYFSLLSQNSFSTKYIVCATVYNMNRLHCCAVLFLCTCTGNRNIKKECIKLFMIAFAVFNNRLSAYRYVILSKHLEGILIVFCGNVKL